MSRPELDAYLETLRVGREDPVALAAGLWPDLTLEPWQRAALRLMWRNARVSGVCCNGSGKTLVLAIAVILFMLCYPPAIVVTTAGSWTQVRRQLWKEIGRLHAGLPEAYRFPQLNKTDWTIARDWFALGVSTRNSELFEGHHGPHVMVIVDEAKSVDASIFDAVNRIFAGNDDVRCAIASSAGMPAGPHYDSHHGRAERWARFVVADDVAQIYENGEVKELPGSARLSSEYVEEMRQEYGEDSPLFLSMCKAQWGDTADRRLFPLSVLDAMQEPLPARAERHRLGRYMGVDVARGGIDECAIVVSEDYRDHALEEELETGPIVYTGVLELEAFKTEDVMVLQDAIIDRARQWEVPGKHILIDAGGIGGGVIDNLRRGQWQVQGVMFGAGSKLEVPPCADLISEIWWKASRKAKAGQLKGVTDPRLRSQLNHRKYYYDDRDLLKVEPKKKMRQRMARLYPTMPWHSPDRADGFLLASHRRPAKVSPAWGDARIG